MLGLRSDQKKKKKQTHIDVNPIEAVRDVSGNVGRFGNKVADSFRQDVAKKGAEDFWKQILGKYEQGAKHVEQDLIEGEEMILSQHTKQTEQAPVKLRKPDTTPGIDYHREMRYTSERGNSVGKREMEAKIEQILVELEKLIESSSELESRFEVLAIQQTTDEPGTYHLNFYEWLLGMIQSTRHKIEDSGAWLSALQNKKSKRSYWAMFKKHGTSFGMSNERMVSTQTG